MTFSSALSIEQTSLPWQIRHLDIILFIGKKVDGPNGIKLVLILQWAYQSKIGEDVHHTIQLMQICFLHNCH